MEPFGNIYERAAKRKGGPKELEKLLSKPLSTKRLASIGDDRWLAGMTKAVFRAGFNWKVIESKWPGFEEAFWGFDPNRCAMMSDEDLDSLLKNRAIVRHAKKILSVRDNGLFLCDLAKEHGSAGRCIAEWPVSDHIGLLAMLKKRGNRLGGTSAQYFLREMGKESFILSGDVTTALIGLGVIEKPPTSKAALMAVQEAFNNWKEESGRSMNAISRVLACSVGN